MILLMEALLAALTTNTPQGGKLTLATYFQMLDDPNPPALVKSTTASEKALGETVIDFLGTDCAGLVQQWHLHVEWINSPGRYSHGIKTGG